MIAAISTTASQFANQSKSDATLELRRPYRLGDMVKLSGTGLYGIDTVYARMHAMTIGGRYMNATQRANDFAVLSTITDDVCSSARTSAELATVIHLRLGDVLCMPTERVKAPLPAEAFSERINSLIPAKESKLLLSGNHRHACVAETRAYLNAVERLIPHLRVRHDESHGTSHVDDDFCTLVNAPRFVAGRGGFSEMAVRVRELHNRSSIEDPALSGYVLGGRWSRTDLELEQLQRGRGAGRFLRAVTAVLLLATLVVGAAALVGDAIDRCQNRGQNRSFSRVSTRAAPERACTSVEVCESCLETVRSDLVRA